MNLINSIPIIERLELWDKKNSVYIPFKLWDIQKDLMHLIYNHRLIIALKKRQVGATQLVGAADNLVQSAFRKNFTVPILSKTGQDADEVLFRAREMYRRAPADIKTINPVLKGLDGGDEIVFTSGSRMISLPANKGRGLTGDRLFIDEAAHITKRDSHTTLEEVLRGVYAVLEKALGQLIIMSTANGMGKYQQIFMKAIKGENLFKHFFISCWSDPTFSKKDRENIIKNFGEDHANQEYPRTIEEAFLASGRPRFDTKAIQWQEKHRLLRPLLKGEITFNGVLKNDNGEMLFFKKRKERGQYVIFGDVAEGLEHGDYSCAKVFEIDTWEQVAEWHGHIEHAMFGTVLYYLGIHYNNAYIAPECNNHGHTAIMQLKNVHLYPEELIFESKFIRQKPDDDFKNPEHRYGWLTTVKTKKIIIDNLAAMLIRKELPAVTEDDLSEMKTYIKDAKGNTNAEENCYDDRVMTLAIAMYLLKFYEIKKWDDWQNCSICECKNEDELYCIPTKGKVSDIKVCSLFRERTYIDKQMVTKPKHSKYIRACKKK